MGMDVEEHAAAHTSLRTLLRSGQGSLRPVDFLLGLLVLVGTFARIADGERWTIVSPQSMSELAIFVAAGAAVGARLFPLPALAVTAGLDALEHWHSMGAVGIHVAFMICTFMVAAHGPRRLWGSAVAAAFVAQMVFMSWSLDWWWGHAFVMVAGMSALLPAALGVAARSRRATVAALQSRADEAERFREAEARKLRAEERLRVARDLHDSVAHQIAVMNLNAAVASQALPEQPDDATRALVTVREAGRAVIASIGELLSGLREGDWDDREQCYDIAELHQLVNEFSTLLPAVTLEVEPTAASAQAVDAVPYLVIREGLTNAYKHGDHGAPVTVRLGRLAHAWSVRVVNATGDSTSPVVEGFGLQGMRERVSANGGELHVSCSNGLFVLTARVPEKDDVR
jgi:signal transduction histidine kinase